MIHGANGVDVRRIMSLAAERYCWRLARLRQSSDVIFQRFAGVSSRSRKRRSCSSGLTSIQNLSRIAPQRASSRSKSLISS